MASLLHPKSSRSSPSKPSTSTHPHSHSHPRHPRQSSGVYNAFSQKQIKGFKEAFSMLDQDSDGLISRSDLKVMLQNLGQRDDEAIIQRHFDTALLSNQNGKVGINFTQFLTMFGEHLAEMDDGSTLMDAFECFDEKDEGWIDVSELREWLGSVGDKMSQQEIDRLLSGPFTDRSGKRFDYKAFVEAIKMSEPEEVQ